MICCDEEKAIAALAKLLRHHDGTLTENQAAEAAKYMHAHFTPLPKSWGFGLVIREIQKHPYK
jgi:hypothetical protein